MSSVRIRALGTVESRPEGAGSRNEDGRRIPVEPEVREVPDTIREDEMAAEAGSPRRPRRSREEVCQALVMAAAALFGERASGRVTVRDIAARADVNPALVHRYFGTKQRLMRAAMEKSQRTIATEIDEMADVLQGAGDVFRATLAEKEFIAFLARASLDGVLPDLPAGNPAMRRLVQRFEAEGEKRGTRGRHDPHVVVACLSCLAMGYALFGQFIRRGTGLDGEPDERVEAAIVEILRDMAGSAFHE
jgi:AcrR family transcriptional regulator